ncbi:MAG: hypothetical protein ACX93O_03860 [Flagellimonas sp.]
MNGTAYPFFRFLWFDNQMPCQWQKAMVINSHVGVTVCREYIAKTIYGVEARRIRSIPILLYQPMYLELSTKLGHLLFYVARSRVVPCKGSIFDLLPKLVPNHTFCLDKQHHILF